MDSDAARVVSDSRTAPAGWDALTVSPPGGHVFQGTAWAQHLRQLGASPHFLTFSDGRTALVTLRESRFIPGPKASVRRGPAHAGDPPEMVAARCAALVAWARTQRVRELFMDPQRDADPRYEQAMDRLGFAVAPEVEPSIHVMRLALPDGTTLESLHAGLAKSTRQRIASATKAGVIYLVQISRSLKAFFAELRME